MDSFGGFLDRSIVFSFFLDGFVQYLSKRLLANQFCCDSNNEAARVPLQSISTVYANTTQKSVPLRDRLPPRFGFPIMSLN